MADSPQTDVDVHGRTGIVQADVAEADGVWTSCTATEGHGLLERCGTGYADAPNVLYRSHR